MQPLFSKFRSKEFQIKLWRDVAVHVAASWLGFYGMFYAFLSSQNKTAYGFIGEWWAALYIGYVFSVKATAAIPLMIFYAAVVVLCWYAGWNIIDYKGFDYLTPSQIMIIALTRAMFYVSPIFVNTIVRTALQAWEKRK